MMSTGPTREATYVVYYYIAATGLNDRIYVRPIGAPNNYRHADRFNTSEEAEQVVSVLKSDPAIGRIMVVFG